MFARRTLPFFVAAILSAVTITAAVSGAATDRQTVTVAREHALETTTQAAAALGASLEASVSDVAGLFNASRSVSADEFSTFTEPMLADTHAAALSYVELVDGPARPAFERRTGLTIREQNIQGEWVPAYVDERYAVVRYVKTADDNGASLGADALASDGDAAAIAAAERTRSAQSTKPMPLDSTGDLGVRLYVPVYGADSGPTATRKPIGFVAGAFRFQDLTILSAPAPGAQTRLRISGAAGFQIGEVHGDVSSSQTLIAGRTWQLSVSSPTIAKQLFGLTRAQAAGIFLTLLTLLITAVTRQAVVAADRSDELAALRQAERDQAVDDRVRDQVASHELLTHLPDLAVIRFDADLRITSASGGLLPHAGWSSEELEGQRVVDAFSTAGAVVDGVRAALDGQASGFSFNGIRSAEKRYWMQTLPLPGSAPGGLLVTSDVTALMGAESARAKAQARFERVFESAPVGMALVSTNGKFVQVNEAMAQITGYDAAALLRMGPADVTHPDDIDTTRRQLGQLLSGSVPGLAVEKRYRHADGHIVWVSLNTNVLTDESGQPEYILAHVLDITDRHEFAEQLQHLANHDPLTDLRNRRSFEEALATQAAYVRRYHEPSALLMIDLDHFKAVNDTYGHQAGDRVLTGTADTLRLVLRDSDTIGRLGGDEFAVLLPKANPSEAIVVAEKVSQALRELGARLAGETGPPPVTASIGVAILRGQHRSIDEVFADADGALYSVKTAGRDGFLLAQDRGTQAA